MHVSARSPELDSEIFFSAVGDESFAVTKYRLTISFSFWFSKIM